MPSSPTQNRILALRRARARRRNGGAVIFIVATTLGVLAVMGVYALAATTQDLRAAANVQRGAQAVAVSGYGASAVADYVTVDNADDIIYRRMLNPIAGATTAERNCISTQRNNALLFGDDRTKSCVRISAQELKLSAYGGREPFSSQSFTHSSTVTQQMNGDVYIELTNPAPAPKPPGFDKDSPFEFTMVTATAYGIIKPLGATNGETVQVARGRIIVGPMKGH